MKAKMIFIEGVDRTGKGSLMQAIHKETQYKHVVFDRGVISNIVYATVNGRLTTDLMRQYQSLEKQIAKSNHVVIYLTCSTEVLKERMENTNHEYVDFDLHKKVFEEVCSSSPLNIKVVDTSNKTPEQIAKLLKEAEII